VIFTVRHLYTKFIHTSELRAEFNPCRRHIGLHCDAKLLCRQQAVALLPRSCRCPSGRVARYLANSFAVFLAFSLYRLSPRIWLALAVFYHPSLIPKICLWNLWCAASSLFFVATNRGHSSAPCSIVDITTDLYSLSFNVMLICLFFQTDFNLPNTLLALPSIVWQSLSQLLLLNSNCSHIR